ncbi:MAG: pyruvate carboxylase subunit B [Candidatus Edwardsbacteria bacterium]|nr:pyruvate carboxylase subunit B [Candidatus Edwardsbacteria bacterium]MBU1576072.1 pyruvate carboxylase subunit B [Candidatus Edwardsbacteria bacterium]MBU2463674.1 pyruvate carboxylase subunit B [Candidatus Edwardsbacteria bacterium]MBU2594142.1 pyruvate carboxylase subunit B [Candidatus Edwardsbacteria bacterium]
MPKKPEKRSDIKKGGPEKHTVNITETAFRDAHQSLIATRMRTEDMIPMIEKMDQVGYWSFEMWGGATFDTMLRFLDENPWDRIRIFKKHAKKTKLQMLLRGQNLVGYKHYADDILEHFIKKAAELGIDVFRVFDALNDIRNMEKAIVTAKKAGATVQGAISYTLSPVHSIDGFVKFAQELKDLGCDIITIKDMAGLISPASAKELVGKLKSEVGLPVCLHSHCTTGMAPTSYFAAAQAGADILDCAISPFGSGTSQPPTETMVEMLDNSGFGLKVDKSHFLEIAEYFQEIKDTAYQHLITPVAERVDVRALVYQVPGGMLTNMVSQLEKQNASDKFEAVLKEIPKVRAELGYVPLVTPTSQIVGTQATFNVLGGERYKMIIQEVKDLCKGLYGKTPAPIDPVVMKKAIGDEKPITDRPANHIAPEWEKCKKEMEGISDKEEDILSYALYPAVAKEYFAVQKDPLKKKARQESLKAGVPSPEGHPQRHFVMRVNDENYEVGITEIE